MWEGQSVNYRTCNALIDNIRNRQRQALDTYAAEKRQDKKFKATQHPMCALWNLCKGGMLKT